MLKPLDLDEPAVNALSDVHFGTVEAPLSDWRASKDDTQDDDSDEELETSPPDVVEMLGFDPLELDSMAQDEEEGHAFHGNQYTGGIGGEKPTSTSAKGVKSAVHELLSSGHSFSFDELKAITKGTDSTLKTALADLKNPKYAGKMGALEIVKDPGSSQYFAKKPGWPGGPTAPVAPIADAPATTGAPKVAKPPASGKMSPEDASKIYQVSINHAGADLKGAAHNSFESKISTKAMTALLKFKEARALAMAQWYADCHGDETLVAPQQIFKADKLLWDNLQKGADFSAAFSQWKKDTSAEKKGQLGAAKPTPPKPAPNPEASKIAIAPSAAVASLKGKNAIPANFEHINGKMFEPSAKHKGETQYTVDVRKSYKAFEDDSISSTGNKADIEENLNKLLESSKAYQEVNKSIGPGLHSDNKTLAARLVSSWAGSSGDHNQLSCAMQVAVQEAFGMEKNDVELKALGSLESVSNDQNLLYAHAAEHVDYKGNPQTFKAALIDFAHAQYTNTQNFLKARGVTEVSVMRGMKMQTGHNASLVELKLQPASSFSLTYSTASKFGQSVFLTRVPASQVLGSYRTGFGCTGEEEVVVLASKGMRAVRIGKHMAGSLSSATGHIQSMEKEW